MATFDIPLDIPDVEIENVEITKNGDVIITVVSTVEGTCCYRCGREISKPYGHGKTIKLRHLSILGKKTYIHIRPVRYQCTHCGGKPVTTQTLNWYNPRSPHIKVYDEHILLEMVNNTVEDVSIKEGLGYEAIMGILYRYIDTEVNWDGTREVGCYGTLMKFRLRRGMGTL